VKQEPDQRTPDTVPGLNAAKKKPATKDRLKHGVVTMDILRTLGVLAQARANKPRREAEAVR
jgi:hypothetical protein